MTRVRIEEDPYIRNSQDEDGDDERDEEGQENTQGGGDKDLNPWDYVKVLGDKKKKMWRCLHCHQTFGGGATRIK